MTTIKVDLANGSIENWSFAEGQPKIDFGVWHNNTLHVFQVTRKPRILFLPDKKEWKTLAHYAQDAWTSVHVVEED